MVREDNHMVSDIDIVELLRANANLGYDTEHRGPFLVRAADEIERLRAESGQLLLRATSAEAALKEYRQ